MKETPGTIVTDFVVIGVFGALVASAVTMWKLTGREYNGRDSNSGGDGINPRNSISLDR